MFRQKKETPMIWLVRAVLGAVLLAAAAPAHAQSYPSKPVTIVIGYTPGAVSDLTARTIADGLQQAWGQTFIVDNRPGSGGNIGAALVARAVPDGYTLMVGTDAQMASNVHLYKHVGFDPVKDFAPVAFAGANIICLAVNAELPIKTVADVIDYAKKNPGKLNYGSSGTGSPHHLAGELLRQKAGIDIAHIPYKGGGAAVNDLLGGHIGMAFLSLSAAVPHMNTGKIRIVAMVEKTRYAALPDIPTIGETVPGFEMSSWIGIFAPAGTPADIVAKLNDGIARVLTAEGVKAKLANLGLVVIAGKPQELAEVVKEGLRVRGELVKAAGIQPE
ncbi:MAG: tripartite tricarboxylate transporter substrate binding protein [Alphaproteobacteria bacterium]|nr:MAG: tripartite tricarboxylate transporter substrate binding protein [Alphaproteobacteria bacterium]